MTRLLSAIVLLAALPPCLARAQAPSGPASGVSYAAAPAAAPAAAATPALPAPSATLAPAPSATLAPALAGLRQTLIALRPEKWKAPSPVTRETQNNLDSIRRDLDTTLPPLLSTADANPSSLPQVLPVYRNIEALYDVLLRVNQVAILVAPDAQANALQHAINSLEDSRRALGDSLQTTAVAQTQQVADLRASLHKLQTAPPPPVPVCAPPPAATTAKKKPAAKPAPKPAQPATPAPQ